MKNQRKKGFTLIELLVVITIIGILAGIAFVGFGDVFGSAGRTTAQKNLKTVYESLAAKTRSFPMNDDVGSVEEFVVWWRNKTKDTRPELWFIGEDEEVISSTDALAIVQTRCITCHSAKPTHADFEKAPGGMKFDTIDDVRTHSAKILAQAVLSKSMPLGNATKMTIDERKKLGLWIRSGVPD